jgi:hypothetical protein
MKQLRINAREAAADIKSRKSDEQLMKKYELNVKALARLKHELLSRSLVTEDDLKAQGKAPPRKKINSDRFLDDFRARPDDSYLMEKYELKPKQLRKVYSTLIERGLLSEFEYEGRDIKSVDVEEYDEAQAAASTVVSVVERVEFERHVRDFSPANQGLPKEFFKDFSGIKIGTGYDALPGLPQLPGGSAKSRTLSPSTAVEVIEYERCPNCGNPKHVDYPDSCRQCGIVYAKFKPGKEAAVVGYREDKPARKS